MTLNPLFINVCTKNILTWMVGEEQDVAIFYLTRVNPKKQTKIGEDIEKEMTKSHVFLKMKRQMGPSGTQMQKERGRGSGCWMGPPLAVLKDRNDSQRVVGWWICDQDNRSRSITTSRGRKGGAKICLYSIERRRTQSSYRTQQPHHWTCLWEGQTMVEL